MRALEVPNAKQTGETTVTRREAPLRATRSNMRNIIHELLFYLLLSSLFTLCDRVVENLIYVRFFHLLWFNFVVKGTFGLCCTARA